MSTPGSSPFSPSVASIPIQFCPVRIPCYALFSRTLIETQPTPHLRPPLLLLLLLALRLHLRALPRPPGWAQLYLQAGKEGRKKATASEDVRYVSGSGRKEGETGRAEPLCLCVRTTRQARAVSNTKSKEWSPKHRCTSTHPFFLFFLEAKEFQKLPRRESVYRRGARKNTRQRGLRIQSQPNNSTTGAVRILTTYPSLKFN